MISINIAVMTIAMLAPPLRNFRKQIWCVLNSPQTSEHFVSTFARNLISKSQKQNLPLASPLLSNSECSIVHNVLTSRALFSFIKIVEFKAVCSKHSLTLLLLIFPCSVSSQQKVFWKVVVSKFVVEILQKH